MPKLNPFLGRPVRILMIEDNPGDSFLVKEALGRARTLNEIMTIENGDEALSFLNMSAKTNGHKPDLILLDLNLPGTDGREVLTAIKSDPELKRIPVVVLTTSQYDQDVIAAYDRGANAYLVKPTTLDGVLDLMRRMEDFWLSLARLPSDNCHAVEDVAAQNDVSDDDAS